MDKKTFKRKVKQDANGCWIWQSTMVNNGYGRVQFNKKPSSAHRIGFHLFTGFDLSSPLGVLHKCNNRRCVNPKHLYAGTPRDNAFDAIRAGDWVDNNGDKSGLARLTNKQAQEIRRRYRKGEQQLHMAKEFSVHANTIWRIINNLTYRK